MKTKAEDRTEQCEKDLKSLAYEVIEDNAIHEAKITMGDLMKAQGMTRVEAKAKVIAQLTKLVDRAKAEL